MDIQQVVARWKAEELAVRARLSTPGIAPHEKIAGRTGMEMFDAILPGNCRRRPSATPSTSWRFTSKRALRSSKRTDIERIEINEAFAAIALACLRELDLPEDIVNAEGGSIAHGHAIGATGAVLTTRLLHSMRRDGLKRGIVTLCIGGGQGIALALEMI